MRIGTRRSIYVIDGAGITPGSNHLSIHYFDYFVVRAQEHSDKHIWRGEHLTYFKYIGLF